MFELLRGETKRIWISYWRYPLEFLSGLVVMFVTFYLIVVGAEHVAGSESQFGGDRASGLILGYWLWNLTRFAFTYTATALREEALRGTLEQVYLSPFGTLFVFLTRSAASLSINIFTSTLLLGLLLLFSGQSLSFPPLIVVALSFAGLAAYGIGFLMAALTLLFKQIGQFLTIAQFLLLPTVFVPFETLDSKLAELYVFLPIAPAAAILRSLMASQVTPDSTAFLHAFINGACYLAVGLALFHLGDRVTRRRGLVGAF